MEPAEAGAQVVPARGGLLNPALCAPGRAARPGLQDGAPGPAHLRPRVAERKLALGMNGALFAGSRGCPGQARPAQRRLYARGMEMSLRPCRRSPIPFPSQCGGMLASRKGTLAGDAALAALKPH
ncbi:hypothetical protein PAL_GLEAN10023637 [Pteropus alecto]|uniref:Uncharacterized protein n=1 Tax=Pteropus alecto TaxID=9402 RepID=L5K1W3_PTEAL|nr:hypothetical protein PAL_GLEAN10023637 [Pteropus alecto]